MTELLSQQSVALSPTLLPIPPNEAERLAALHRYDILDTPPEVAFDRITGLAARLFDAPIALVSLVDETRAWFKSCVGFGAPEVPRDATICSFALLYDSPLIVPDARLDDRFSCNPFVLAEPGLRFYAGAPLLTQDGYNLGTLCLLDTKPRSPLTADQEATLVDLAAMVVDELELRLAARKVAQVDAALLEITQGVARVTGEAFFYALVQHFAKVLNVDYTYIGVVVKSEPPMLKTIATCAKGEIVDNLEYFLHDTPCWEVIQQRKICCYPHNVQAAFPNAPLLKPLEVESYVAVPFFDSADRPLGLLGVMDGNPLDNVQLAESLLTIFGLRIATELERQQAEEERTAMLQREQEARQQAEAANRLKDEFLAVLSHELRSPLNPILGWSKLLQTRQFDPAKQQEAIATIERNAKLQVQLIDDLLDVSRILRGKLALQSAPVNLAIVIQAAIETVRLAAQAKSIDLRLQIDSNLSDKFRVLGDAARLQQVVWNLLSNAIKFTPHGGRVDVQLGVRDQGLGVREQPRPNPQPLTPNPSFPNPPFACLIVSDTGKGIHPDFLPHVFEHFRQEDGSTTRKFGGLGLGLAIARQITEMHGGSIWADSTGEGQGATFTVQLPLLPCDNLPTADRSIATAESPAAPLTGIRVLVVDDADDTRDLLMFLLEAHGAIAASVCSAAEALQTVEQFQPDILLSDIGMPDMNGYDLLRSIRSQTQGKLLPAIALTAYATDADRQTAIAAGFQRHLAKPIEPQSVIACIVELVRSPQS